MKQLLFIVISSLIVCCSCSSSKTEVEDTVSITVSPASFNIKSDASEATITVQCNQEWAVASSNESWCKVSPSGGLAGTAVVKVTFAENTKLEERSTTITVRSGAERKTIDVKQEAGVLKPYRLVWSDEFDDARTADGKGVLVNPSKWYYEVANKGWVNNELQAYVAGVRGKDTTAYISDGTLKIIARKSGNDIISARINTVEAWTYGIFEARLKLPKGKGTWPAFWMMPKNFTAWPDDGEIDIMEEVGCVPNEVSSSIHCKAYYHSIGTQKTAKRIIPNAEGEFHVYKLEWTEDYITTYVDDVKLFTFLNDKRNDKKTWPFNAPFNLKLNLAWGGDWGGMMGVDESALPCVYEIDYVRVYQRK